MIYEIGTISTKANDPKITGKNTLWKNSVTKVSVGQIILIQSGNTIYQNSIRSVESDTQMTLSFPVPVALTDVKYVISITMIGSVSDGVNKATAMVTESYQLMMILNRLMTESGVIKVVLPDGTEMQLRTEKERDRLLDGKLNKLRPEADELLRVRSAGDYASVSLAKKPGERVDIETLPDSSTNSLNIIYRDKEGKNVAVTSIPKKTGTAMLVGEYGIGGEVSSTALPGVSDVSKVRVGFYRLYHTTPGMKELGINDFYGTAIASKYDWNVNTQILAMPNYGNDWLKIIRKGTMASPTDVCSVYTTKNTTKDANGNLKAASPVVKLFADNIELNEESEGVEMEHLGIGHYLIKGVVGFNADGAWGINNGFVIPQDHNGKNMVLIDYEVRPDGDIEVFVFHQQNADMPERFQNKRIKHFDEEGVPVYFENYEPCDVPESRWIDMRVEMPPNSLYNQKQAEAERLAKLEAERLAQEEAKRAAEEAERAEQESFEGGNNSPL
ncbi:hypothetical protein ACPW90_000082 [Providencia rettgeri]|uniref:phage tail fiber protein n=1 Tax=Providencia rettgeri TaxID=587 RepID=UPI0022716F81|nr:hypothetical protein [Providencia rettgeri]MCX9094559.1 hypothetical protein [Providencia rettgeri]